jgi:hypothetical protein
MVQDESSLDQEEGQETHAHKGRDAPWVIDGLDGFRKHVEQGHRHDHTTGQSDQSWQRMREAEGEVPAGRRSKAGHGRQG